MAKSKSSKSTRSSRIKTPKTKKVPCTPTGGVRRFFFKLELLGQRRVEQLREFSHRHHNHDADKTPKQRPRPVSTAHPAIIVANAYATAFNTVSSGATLTHTHTCNAHHLTPGSAPPHTFKIALQNHDPDHPDAIVITTLDLEAPPFCCHEDLLAMQRSQLLVVADALNSRLPCALAINTDEARPESWIRSEIEWVVGIRGEREKEVEVGVPGAPRAVRTWGSGGSWSMRDDFDILEEMERSPPTSPSPSPLTRKSLQMSPRSPRLERLAEEDEEGSELLVLVSKAGRAAKTTRAGGRTAKKRRMESAGEADVDAAMEVNDLTPTAVARVPRTRSCSAAMLNVSPTPRRVLRSKSHNLGKKPSIEMVFRDSTGPKLLSGNSTGVPEVAIPRTPRKTRSLRPLNGYRPFMAPEDEKSGGASASSSSSLSGLGMTEAVASSMDIGRKRKRRITDEEEEEEEENRMASGMKGMSMNMGDMDVGTSLVERRMT